MKKDWKGCPPRVKRIGVVDDDSESRKTLVELIEVEDLIDDCEKQGGVNRNRFVVGGFMWDSNAGGRPSIRETLHQLIKPVDLEWTKVKSKLSNK